MYIIHIGISGFPQGNAEIQRIRFTFKSLLLAGFNAVIINKASLHQSGSSKHVSKFDGIVFVNTSIKARRPNSFILRSLNKLSGFIFEFNFLFKKRNQIRAAIFYSPSFWELMYYSFLSQILNFKLVIQYVEFRSSIPSRKQLFTRLNDFLFDNYCFFLCDGIFVISEFLKTQVLKKKPALPFLKLPAITDFDTFNISPASAYSKYLMYCGTNQYLDVVIFIIDIFERLRENEIYNGNLLLIVSGQNNANVKIIENRIAKSKYALSFIVKKNVPDIAELYVGASLLFIPLRKTTQDIARFPHKISEYTASKVAFVSTNVGDVSYYFKNGVSAVLADEYSVDSYYDAIVEYLASQTKVQEIGEKGYEIGMNNFNYKAYSEKLRIFFTNL